jgi:hypothetical protein
MCRSQQRRRLLVWLGLALLAAIQVSPVQCACKVKESASSVQNSVAVAPHQSRVYTPSAAAAAAPVYVQAPSVVYPAHTNQPPPAALIYPDVVTTTQRTPAVRKRTRGVQHAAPTAAAPKAAAPRARQPPVYAPAPVYVAPQAAQPGPVYVPAPPSVVASESSPLRNKARRIPNRQVTPISYSTDLSTASDATGYNLDLKTATSSGIPASEIDLNHAATGQLRIFSDLAGRIFFEFVL